MSNDSLFSKVKKSFLQILSGNVFYTICSFIAAFFFARILGPELYGTWQTAMVFIGYSMIFSLSLPFVMRRDFIQLRSEGEYEKANKIAWQVFSYSLVGSPIFVLFLVLYGTFFVENYLFSISIYAIAIIYSFNIVSSFGDILSKGFNNYNILKWSSIINGLMLLLTILFVFFWGYYGLLTGYILSALSNAIYYYINKPIPFKWFWDWKLLKSMMLIAIPLYLQDIVQTIFTSIDRLIIASQLSFEQVGYYSLSTLVKTPITLIMSSLGIVLFTQINEKYGKSKDASVIKLHMNIPQVILSYFIPVVIIIGILALPLITELFIPKYIPGIKTAQIFVFAVFFLLMAGYSSSALFILNKQWYAAIAFLIAGVLKTIGSFWMIKNNYGIEGVAISTLVAYFVYDILMVFSVYRLIGLTFLEALAYLLKKNLPVLISLIIYMGVNYYIEDDKSIIFTLVLKEIAFIFLSIPILYLGYNKVKFFIRKN